MQRGLWRLIRLFACAALAGQCIGGATSPQRKSPARHPEIEKAISELKREYAAATKGQSRAALRKGCDYFGRSVTPVPCEALLVALEKPVTGTDDRLCAYVKWQLLSALPKDLDESTVQRLLKVYRQAPVPALRYGCAAPEKRQLDKLLAGKRLQDDVGLSAALEEAVGRGFAADGPIIAYRDELYRRLPAGRDKFVAALQDAHARIGAAGQKDKLAEALAADLTNWASLAGTDRAHVREVAELVGKLRFVQSPPYYAKAAVRRGKLVWVTDTDTLLTTTKFAKLHKLLLDAGGVPSLAVPAGSKRGGGTATKDRKTGNNS